MKYRKKRVNIEAVQWLGNCEIINHFCGKNVEWKWNNEHDIVPVIHTLEGDVISNLRDYIIKGVGNEFYPVSENKFNEIYEHVHDIVWKKRPIEVEAVQYDGEIKSLEDFCYIYKYNENKELMVRTAANKWLIVSKGDYIVKEGDGYHPVKPDIFEQTYEEVGCVN